MYQAGHLGLEGTQRMQRIPHEALVEGAGAGGSSMGLGEHQRGAHTGGGVGRAGRLVTGSDLKDGRHLREGKRGEGI